MTTDGPDRDDPATTRDDRADNPAHDGDEAVAETGTADPGDSKGKKPTLPVGIGLADVAAGVASEVYAESDDRPDDATGGLAYASPSLNRVEFHVHPDPQDDQGESLLVAAQAKTMREELLHGERSHLGVARNIRLLDRRVQHLLESLAALGNGSDETGAGDTGLDPDDVRAIRSEITDLRSQRAAIESAREPAVEAVDKFHVHTLLSDESDVLDDLIEGQNSDEFIQDQARRYVERMVDGGDDGDVAGAEYHDPRVYEDLKRVYEELGWRVAEAAATAAFDVPYLLEAVAEPARELGVAVEEFETVPTGELESVLEERFDAAVAVAETATADLPEDASDAELTGAIRTRITERTDRPIPRRTPSDVSMPLLDVPARRDTATGPPGVGESKVTALQHAETPVGYLLAGAFRTVGDFGGALYVTPDGQWQWAINPWVAGSEIDIDLDGLDSYDTLWAHTYVRYRLAEQLGEPLPRRVRCPLCARSPTSACGSEGCAFENLIDGVNEALTVL